MRFIQRWTTLKYECNGSHAMLTWRPSVSLTLHETHCVHSSMNIFKKGNLLNTLSVHNVWIDIGWMAKTILQGTMKGGRRRRREKKRWRDTIKEWTGMKFGDSLKTAEDKEKWKGIVATSSVVLRRPLKLRDWDDWWDRLPLLEYWIKD